MKGFIKRAILGQDRREQRIPFGLFSGLKLHVDPDGEFSLWAGLFERETAGWLRKACSKAQSFVDIGAGNGELTVWALSQPHIQKVLAFEPKQDAWNVFRCNLASNGLATDRRFEGHEEFFLGSEKTGAARELIGRLPEPVVVKIDVDGGEETILRRMGETLREKALLFLIETHSEQLDARCSEILRDAGYRVQTIARAWWRRFWPERRLPFNQWLAAEKIDGRG